MTHHISREREKRKDSGQFYNAGLSVVAEGGGETLRQNGTRCVKILRITTVQHTRKSKKRRTREYETFCKKKNGPVSPCVKQAWT